MSYTNGLDDPTLYFNTKLYTGNGSTQSITGVGFQPDMVWGKRRDGVVQHSLLDSVRTAQYTLFTNLTDGDTDNSPNDISSFDSDGFSLGSYGSLNASGGSHVAWNWKAGGTASSNTDGSITSTVSASTVSGFSIVSYTGTGSNATIGHGLNSVPKIVLTKNRDTADNWLMYHASTGNTGVLYLNETYAFGTSSAYWNNTSPTSSVFSVGTEVPMNKSGDSIIAFCFAEKKGFSKFGSYVGNGSSDGSYIHLGFKPAFVISKASSTTSNWHMWDNKRDIDNVIEHILWSNLSNAEITSGYTPIDFLSNGFKMRDNNGAWNGSGTTYIYMAFAENPFVTSTGIPTTAR